MFNRFFSKGHLASTYKPVFLRALLDIGDFEDSQKGDKLIGKEWITHKDGKILLNLNFIAVRFAKYYWDMEYSFRLRQSQDPQDANITRMVREYHDPAKKPPTIKELTHNNMEQFRKQVITKSIKPEVLVHLKTDMHEMYEKIDSNTISFDDDIIEFLHVNKTLLKKGLNHVLAKYLEKLNPMTIQISNKIDYEKATRKTLKNQASLAMLRWQDSKCFYCNRKFEKAHVDHVIPFNYVFSTDIYNCVLACQQCNCIKSDMLPEIKFFDDVIGRNEDISNYLKSTNTFYSKKSYKILFESCATEYNGGAFFHP